MNAFFVEVGVAVEAAVAAGVVLSDIYALHTAAFCALVFILLRIQRPADKLLYPRRVNAAAVTDTILRQVRRLRTGADTESVRLRTPGEACRHLLHLFRNHSL